MRFYEIDITLNSGMPSGASGVEIISASGSTQLNNYLKLKLNESNPYAVRITFNFQSFSDGSLFTPSVLTIYNPATAFFTSIEGLKGATIVVKAGIKDSVYMQKLETTTCANNVLFNGHIQRAVPYFGGREPCVALLCSPISEDAKEVIRTLESGKKVADYIKDVLSAMFSNAEVVIDKGAESLTLQNKQTEQRPFKSFNEVCAFAMNQGLKIAIDQNKLIIYNKETLFVNDNVFEPKAQDFISQPEWQNQSVIQCTFALRGDLRVGDTITFPMRMAMSANSFIGNATALAGVQNSNALITAGSFHINGVWHTGDSRNSSANSWATTITATRATNNLANV